MIYQTISCNDCGSDLGYGSACASVTIRDGVTYHTNHTVGCGCTDLLQPCNKVYNPKEYEITQCYHCDSDNLNTSLDCDE